MDSMFSKIVVTGEGPTDMGICKRQLPVCTYDDYEIGPVMLLLNKLLEQHLPPWNTEQLDFTHPEKYVIFIYRDWFNNQMKTNRLIRPSKKVFKGFVEHAQRAAQLARYAKNNECQIAAYFHDTDGTRSQSNNREFLINAIKEGFRAMDFSDYGVPVVPKPKSEAWFLCAFKANPYQHCNSLENELSGNDCSPEKSPKVLLAQALGTDCCSRDLLCENACCIEINKLDMPSFNEVRENMKRAIAAIYGQIRD